MRTILRIVLVVLAGSASADAQLTLVSTEVLRLGKEQAWAMPQWSPDGSAVYYTTAGFQGIWVYAIGSGTARLVTADRNSGFGFTLSPDGKNVAYRRTVSGVQARVRREEAVVKDLRDGGETVLHSGPDVALPSFAGVDVVYNVGGATMGVTPAARGAGTVLLGTQENKIAILRSGVKVLLDPLGGDGRYIWPSLFPDAGKLVAYDMERGTFVTDLEGSAPVRIGRRDAPVWTRDGRWIVYMDDTDDGRAITGSDIACVSPDGKVTAAITATPGRTEMYPRCSPVGDKIVCSTLEGEIIILSYRDAGR